MPYNYCSRTASKQPVVMFGSDQELSWRDEKGADSERDMIRTAWRTALAKTLSWIKEFVHDYTRQHEIYGLCAVKSQQSKAERV